MGFFDNGQMNRVGTTPSRTQSLLQQKDRYKKTKLANREGKTSTPSSYHQHTSNTNKHQHLKLRNIARTKQNARKSHLFDFLKKAGKMKQWKFCICLFGKQSRMDDISSNYVGDTPHVERNKDDDSEDLLLITNKPHPSTLLHQLKQRLSKTI